MSSRRPRVSKTCVGIAVCLAVAFAATAQQPTSSAGKSPATYGTQSVIYDWIPASEFTPDRPDFGLSINPNGYFNATGSDPNPFFFATVRLPNGALWTGVTVYYNDSDAANDMEFLIEQDNISSDTATQLTQVFSSGTPGHTSSFLGLPGGGITIDTSDNFYKVAFNIAISPTLQFRAARIEYYLQVSPAPGSADFGDVPTSSPQFQFIEALYHAGITAGCGGGNYCPNNPVTRGQMAVFLAKALGLHWPG